MPISSGRVLRTKAMVSCSSSQALAWIAKLQKVAGADARLLSIAGARDNDR